VAKAIDILQAETNIQMGWLLPTLTQLKTKLDRIKPSLKFSKPLVDAIQLGLKNRFSGILEDPELIAAAILLPKFKTSWTKDEAILKKGKEKPASFVYRYFVFIFKIIYMCMVADDVYTFNLTLKGGGVHRHNDAFLIVLLTYDQFIA